MKEVHAGQTSEQNDKGKEDFLERACDIIVAFLSKNETDPAQIPLIIREIHSTLKSLKTETPPEAGRNKETAILTRAPRGAARQLIEKSLATGPKTIKEIRDTAKSQTEKFLSYQTVRLELQRGKQKRKYKKIDRKWLLVG